MASPAQVEHQHPGNNQGNAHHLDQGDRLPEKDRTDGDDGSGAQPRSEGVGNPDRDVPHRQRQHEKSETVAHQAAQGKPQFGEPLGVFQ